MPRTFPGLLVKGGGAPGYIDVNISSSVRRLADNESNPTRNCRDLVYPSTIQRPRAALLVTGQPKSHRQDLLRFCAFIKRSCRTQTAATDIKDCSDSPSHQRISPRRSSTAAVSGDLYRYPSPSTELHHEIVFFTNTFIV